MAGMVVDKQWMVAVGERNSGKGFLLALMVAAFGSYVKSCNSENFLYTGPTKDPAKKQSWMLDFKFTRLCYSNEITIDPMARPSWMAIKSSVSAQAATSCVQCKEDFLFKV